MVESKILGEKITNKETPKDKSLFRPSEISENAKNRLSAWLAERKWKLNRQEVDHDPPKEPEPQTPEPIRSDSRTTA
jgi:hypothetical protein